MAQEKSGQEYEQAIHTTTEKDPEAWRDAQALLPGKCMPGRWQEPTGWIPLPGARLRGMRGQQETARGAPAPSTLFADAQYCRF